MIFELFKTFIAFEKRRMEDCGVGLKDFLYFGFIIIVFCLFCRWMGVEQ